MIRKSTNELSIKPKMAQPMRLALGVITFIGACLALYFSFQAGVRSGHQRVNEDRAMVGQLNTTIVGLRERLAAAEQNLTIAQRHQQIQEEAYKQINTAYASSEQKNQYLGSRLDFYRSIISPEDGQSGPAIQALELSREADQLNFELTLVQAIKHKHQVRGVLGVKLLDGDQLLAQWPETSPRSINFQYFQQLSGSFEAANIPENARIEVKLTLQDSSEIERVFTVSQLLEKSLSRQGGA